MKNDVKFNINKNFVNLFLKDVYKDIRKIEVLKGDDNTILRRYSDGVISINDEAKFLNKLISCKNKNWSIPPILNVTDDYIDFKYIRGIRLFNFLIELRYLYLVEHSQKALYVSELIKDITTKNLINFQSLTATLDSIEYSDYPVEEKLLSPITLLCDSSSFDYNFDEVKADLAIISKYYKSISNSLFRDATPKNIIFDEPTLYYDNFIDDADRRNKIRNLVNNDYFNKKILSENLYHIDFSGCKYKCPKIDDFIAANIHECNIWIPSSQFFYNDKMNDTDFLITLFVRYLRFGGRKLCYRIYNSTGHKIRFRFDYEKLYFEQLSVVVEKLTKTLDIKGAELKKIFNYMSSLCDITIDKDYLSQYFDNSDVKYYSGLFPDK